ncbi:MAG: nuclear transport factor 2 family protein [Acidimicrobiia bacterium]|nr:nuclear transport factor 2 family protein [Acidimicrobiia bacterium]
MSNTEAVVMRYWNSWHEGGEPDWATMRSCLADDLDMDAGPMSADAFVEMCQQGAPWTGVTMIDSLFADDRAALIYEGTNTANGKLVRVGEIITVVDGKVARLRAAIPEAALS